MMLVVAMAVPVMAADTVIDGNVVETVEVTAPANFSLGNMSAGATAESGLKTGTVKANAAWQVTAKDVKETSAGKMVSEANVLANKMEVSADNTTYYAADIGLTYSGSATGETGSTLNFYAKQQVTFDDVVATGYTITITFTGSLP